MLTQPIDKVKKFMAENQDGIFVWVIVNEKDRKSIRVSYEVALEWCKGFEDVPCFISCGEIFLGSVIL